jgi:hypothetical protein
LNLTFLYSFSKNVGGYPAVIESFSSEKIGTCRANLGETEPLDYPAPVSFDDKFPIIDAVTGVQSTG